MVPPYSYDSGLNSTVGSNGAAQNRDEVHKYKCAQRADHREEVGNEGGERRRGMEVGNGGGERRWGTEVGNGDAYRRSRERRE